MFEFWGKVYYNEAFLCGIRFWTNVNFLLMSEGMKVLYDTFHGKRLSLSSGSILFFPQLLGLQVTTITEYFPFQLYLKS